MRIAVLAAMPAEAGVLTGKRPRTGDTVLCAAGLRVACAGVGPDVAARATQRLLRDGVHGLVVWGCAGALVPELPAGRLLLPARVVADDGEVLAIDPRWHAVAKQSLDTAATADLAESKRPVTGPVERQRLAMATGAVAVDMESAAVLRVANRAAVPVLVVRVIADSFSRCMPAALWRKGAFNPRALILPWNWRMALQLALGYRAALATLRQVGQRPAAWACPPMPAAVSLS